MRNGLVEGVSLRAVLRESGAMAPEAAASVLAGVLVTLAVVHGDVRPEHVRVDGSGGLALTDFGGTDAQFVPNTPTYLAPERLKGTPANASGDVFSATAVFFECLTTEAPFVAATREDLAALHEYTEVIAEFAPPELRALTQRGLAPDPARRPASPHAFLNEVTTTATEEYGPDWQERGRALLRGWAAAAADAEGVQLATPFGVGETAVVAAAAPVGEPVEEAPPVGEPIDEALFGVDDEVGDVTPAAATTDSVGQDEMPPPTGEPIDEALLDAAPADVAAPEQAETHAEDDGSYDWFSGSSRPSSEPGADPLGAAADVPAAFDGARAVRTPESAPVPYTPTGFDVFADRSSAPAAAADPEPVTGHWDEPEPDVDGGQAAPKVGEQAAEPAEPEPDVAEQVAEPADQAPDVSEQADRLEATAGSSGAEPDADADAADTGAGAKALTEPAGRPEAEAAGRTSGDSSVAAEPDEPEPVLDPVLEPVIEGSSELLAAFDAFSAPTSPGDVEPEPLPTPDPFARLELETLAASSLAPTDPDTPEDPPAAGQESDPVEPETATAAPEADSAAPEPEPEADPEPEPLTDSPADLEDDWVFPTKPSPKVPRSLSAFAVSLPSLPRPQEADEPKTPVRTSAPDDWFRPGVAEPPTGEDAHNTQVLNPDRDNTIESEATRTFDEVPAKLADDGGDGGDADELERDDTPGGPGGPRRKTLVGAVTTAVLLVAGAAAVVLTGSGKAPQGTEAPPTETSSSTAPSPTDMPSTPVGTSPDSGSDTSSSSTPSYHRSTTHSRSRSSSSSSSTHSPSQTPTRSSSSESPTSQSSSSTTPTSSAPTSPTGSCFAIIVPCPTTSAPPGHGR